MDVLNHIMSQLHRFVFILINMIRYFSIIYSVYVDIMHQIHFCRIKTKHDNYFLLITIFELFKIGTMAQIQIKFKIY